MKKAISSFITIILIFHTAITLSAHPGKTDANGGHYDRETGEYHYHNSGSSSSSSGKTGSSKYSEPVYATRVDIHNMPESLNVGDTIQLKGSVYPLDAEDQLFFWESSDNNIASIDSDGNLIAVSAGTVIIKARTVLGTTSQYTLIVKNNVEENSFKEEQRDEISVYLNGTKVDFDVEPQIINGRTMVPIRAIFEAMGANVIWDGATKTATCTKDTTTVEMTLDKTIMYINNTPIIMDVSPVIIDDRTLAPARYVAEAFGADVQWSAKKRIVTLTTNGIPVYADFYNIPNIGKIFGIELKDEFYNRIYSDVYDYVYRYEDVYKISLENPEKVNALESMMLEYGYRPVTQHENSYYSPKYSILYFNSSNPEYAIRIVWCVIDTDEEEVTLVQIEPIVNMYATNGKTVKVPKMDVGLFQNDGWHTEPVIEIKP